MPSAGVHRPDSRAGHFWLACYRASDAGHFCSTQILRSIEHCLSLRLIELRWPVGFQLTGHLFFPHPFLLLVAIALPVSGMKSPVLSALPPIANSASLSCNAKEPCQAGSEDMPALSAPDGPG